MTGRRHLLVFLLPTLLGCAAAEYYVDGDKMTVTWPDGDWGGRTHRLTMPAQNGRQEAYQIAYSRRGYRENLRPRASEGYVDVDLYKKKMTVALRFPFDLKRGWTGHFMEFSPLKWMKSAGGMVDFADNGTYRLVRIDKPDR